MKIVTPLLLLLFFCFSNSSHAQRLGCSSDHEQEKLMEGDPRFARDHQNFLNSIPERAATQNRSSVAPIIRIPVVVHVIHDGEPIGTGQNLSEARIQAQIEVLNLDFNASHPNFANSPARWADDIGDVEIQFCLASIDPSGNPTNGITRHELEVTGTSLDNDNIETDIKPATNWPSTNYMNVWTLPIPGTGAGGGTTGYAYYPSSAGTVRDGSVVDYRWFGAPGFGQSGWGTLTHEVGHYLGLPHPFDDESCVADDGIADTPNIDHPSPNVNCNNGWPMGDVSCGNEAMYINFMDYSGPDLCVTSFTHGQIAVMRATMANERLALANNATAVCSFFDYDIATIAIDRPGILACTNEDVTPEVTFTNLGLETVTNLSVYYQINAETPVLFNWVDNIISGETKSVTLAPFSPPSPTYTFKTWTLNPNGNTDENGANDTLSMTTNILTPINLPINEGFESTTFNPTPSGIFVSNPDGDDYEWEHNPQFGGLGTSTSSAYFNNWSAQGGIGRLDALITPVYEFNDPTETTLSYDYAYSYYQGPTGPPSYDSLIIAVSIDCGNSFDQIIYRNGGQAMATTQPYSGSFRPFPNEWQSNMIDLSSLGNPDNITLAFINKSGYGNNLYLDNINILGACTLATDLVVNQISCIGECDATVQVTSIGASGPLNYEWSDGLGGPTDDMVSGLCEGDYTVTITEDGGCERIETFTITEPDAITFNETIINETSNGGNDGVITIVPAGGTTDYSLFWPAPIPAGTLSASNLSPGIYPVTLEDARGCIAILNAEVLAYDCSSFEATGVATGISCNGFGDGSIDLTLNGGVTDYVFDWDVPGVVGEDPIGLSVGPYNVTVSDSKNCEHILAFEIIEPDALTLNTTSTDETGTGNNDGTATATGGGGADPFTYDWGTFGSGPTITGLAPGTYPVTATDANLCEILGEVIINEFSCDNLSATALKSPVSCFDENDGTAQLTSNGTQPIVYDWSVPGDLGSIHLSLPGGPFSVTITDGNDCQTVFTDVIESPDELIVDLNIDETIACSGDENGALSSTFTGGSDPNTVTYLWNHAGQTTANITGLSAGYYCLTITDENGCEGISEYTFDDPFPLTNTFDVTEPSCFGAADGTITANPVGGTGTIDFDWNIDQTNLTLTGLEPGIYEITLLDNNGCELIESVTLGGPTEIIPGYTITNESTAGANDGAITASGTGGVGNISFDWGAPWNVTNNLSSLPPGTYPVTITDASGCEILDEVVVLSGGVDCTSLDVMVEVFPVSCFGANDGMINAVGIGGLEDYLFSWSTTTQTGPSLTGLAPGTIILTMSDANGCEIERIYEITEPAEIIPSYTITNETTAGANDGAIIAAGSGGVGNISFDWGAPWGVTNALSSLPPGTYPVIITDATGCEIIDQVIITGGGIDCSSLDAEFEIVHVSCNGFNDGMVNVFGFGGQEDYQYDWSIIASGPSLIGLAPGIIEVTITDANQCEIVRTIEITEPDEITVTINFTNETSAGANDGTITASGLGGTGTLIYDWGPAGIGANLGGLSPGTYQLTLRDENGCFIQETVTIEAGQPGCAGFGMELSVTPISCFGEADGSVTAAAFGGDETYSYDWSDTQVGPIAIGLAPGPITVTATDGNGCETIQTVILGNPIAITATTSTVPASTLTTADGQASATGMGGTGTLTYLWSNSQVGPIATGLLPGIYTVEITDAEGCSIVEVVEITADPVDCGSFAGQVNTEAAPCGNMQDGVAAVALTNMVMPVEYIWSVAGTPNQPVVNLPVGPFSVQIINGNGCEIQLNGTIDFVPEIAISNFNITETSGPGINDGAIDLTSIIGGLGAITVNWSPPAPATGTSITGLAAGFYTATITDEGDCVYTQTFEVMEGAGCALAYNMSTTEVSCFGLSDGTAEVSPQGGSGSYTYQWSNFTNGPIITGPAGSYTVTISDNQGCGNVITIAIEEPEQIEVNVLNFDGACGNLGGASAIGSGGTPPFTYLWNTMETEQTITNLPAGQYSVTIADDNECETTGSAVVSNDGTVFELNDLVENVSCADDADGMITLQIVQGTPPYEVLWNTGSTDLILTDLTAGEYSVQIVDGAGCNFISQYEVQSPGEMDVTFQVGNPQPGEMNGSLAANVFGGTAPYSYNWSTGQNGPFIDGLGVGNYEVTITDDNDCQYIESISLTTTSNAEIDGLSHWNIFPNPSTGNVFINIELSTPKALQIQLYSLSGVMVKSLQHNAGGINEMIELDQIAAGTYFVVLRDEDGNMERDKLVVLR